MPAIATSALYGGNFDSKVLGGGRWRGVHKAGAIQQLTFVGNVPSGIRWTGYVACIAETIDAQTNLVTNPKGKRPNRRTSCRWEGNVTLDPKYVRCLLSGFKWLVLGLSGRVSWRASRSFEVLYVMDFPDSQLPSKEFPRGDNSKF